MIDLDKYIRTIQDFPVKGVLFRDITPLLLNPEAFNFVIDLLAQRYENSPIHKIAAIESRGFIFGAPLANRLNVGFIPIRKKGKLPYKILSLTYDLEYGSDTIEIHDDAITKGENILLIDDLIATGGSLCASIELIEKAGGTIYEVTTIIELMDLNGREKIDKYNLYTLLKY